MLNCEGHYNPVQVCEAGPGGGGKELETAGVICLETFHDFPCMARFILRDEGKSTGCC